MDQHRDEPGPPAPRRPAIYKDLILFQLTALVFLVDQLTKIGVREFLDFQESFPKEGFFRITNTFNTGSAFGLFQDQNLPLILASFVGITILVFIYRGQRRPSNLLRLSLGLQLGGAAGNLLDRLRMGHVTDFVDVGPWPIFNVADSTIVVGLIMLAWIFLMADTSKKQGAGSQGTLEYSSKATVKKSIESMSQEGTPLVNEAGDDRVESTSPAADSQDTPVDRPPNSEDEEFSGRRSNPPMGE